jgi:multidrug efflux pump subunit AcrB
MTPKDGSSYSFSIILLTVAVSLIGVLLTPYISVNLNPDYQYPSLSVITNYSHASPEEVERHITRPIESALSTLRGIAKIYSRSSNGTSVVNITLQHKVDASFFKFEALSLLRQLHAGLPKNAGIPLIYSNKPNDEKSFQPILTYSIFAPLSSDAIYKYTLDILSPQLSRIRGLYKIEVTGGSKKEIILEYHREKWKVHGLTSAELSEKIRQHFSSLNIGDIMQDGQKIPVIIEAQSIKELLALPIRIGGTIYPMSEFISVYESNEVPTSLYRINGKNNIRISFIPDAEANHLTLGVSIKDAFSRITLPANFEVLKEYDSTEFIQSELDKIKERTLYSIALLLMFVMIAYRNWKHIVIVVIGLIVSVGISFIFYYLWHVQLNLYTLAATTISFGIIMDNIIVMIHHYGHHQNRLVFPAIISATLTTMSSLIVLWFLPEEWRWNLTDFAQVLAINLMVSLFISYLFIPALMVKLNYPFQTLESHHHGQPSSFEKMYKRWIRFSRKHRNWMVVSMILLFGLPIFQLPIHHKTSEWYNKTLGSDWYLENIRPYANKALGGTLRLFIDYVYTRVEYRSNKETKLIVRAKLPIGSTIGQTDKLLQKLEAYLSQFKTEIKHYATNIFDYQSGQIEITFTDKASSSFPFVLENRLKSLAIDLGDVEWHIYGVGRGFSNDNSYKMPHFRVELRGYNKEKLDVLLNDFANLLEEHPRIEKVDRNYSLEWGEKNKEEYFLSLNQKMMSNLNLDLYGISSILRQQSQLPAIVAYTKDNKAIKLLDKHIKDRDIWNIQNEYQDVADRQVSLRDLTKFEKRSISSTLHKENQQHIRQIEWEYIGTEKMGEKYLNECLNRFTKTAPLGYSIKNVQYENWGKKNNSHYWYLLLIPLIIFTICAIHFESLLRGFQIVLIIPLSFIGIFLTFYWFDFPFDQGGYTSFILTSGIVVNAVIFIFSGYGDHQRKHLPVNSIDLYYLAYKDKIIPIVLTVLSTVLGMVPFVMHGEGEAFWFALAVGTIGGLIFSLFILVIVLPSFIVGKE